MIQDGPHHTSQTSHNTYKLPKKAPVDSMALDVCGSGCKISQPSVDSLVLLERVVKHHSGGNPYSFTPLIIHSKMAGII